MSNESTAMQCEAARPLVPAYLDGEVSEAQAAPLRQHLLACPACRGVAQDGKVLRRWFEDGAAAEVRVPSGFAARVARRAFAGDTGERPLVDAGSPAALAEPAAALAQQGKVLPFVLQLTALAAGVMLTLAIALRSEELPTGDDLRADDRVVPNVEDVVEKLDRLNAEEAAARLARDQGQDAPAGTAGSGQE